MFNPDDYRDSENRRNSRYEKRINFLRDKKGIDTFQIENAVSDSVEKIQKGITSFVIYGEPQSGKTEMMISLTAKLLDIGNNTIVILMNDNKKLELQNLERFTSSGIDPTPDTMSSRAFLEEDLNDGQVIIFSKKNIRNLTNLNEKLRNRSGLIIIDDEADYASPNSKINKDEVTAINNEIGKLLRRDGTYVGVTATPARLDLNNTFDNLSEEWVFFDSHKNYVGKDFFFPINLEKITEVEYMVNILPENGDDPSYLHEALASFLVNASYLNINPEYKEKLVEQNANNDDVNFAFIIHTSGIKSEHERDKKIVDNFFDALADTNKGPKWERYLGIIHSIAEERFGDIAAKEVTTFVKDYVNKKKVYVINSNNKMEEDPTNAPALFTIIIGGNIISRGLTIKNLLGMFFTRTAKHRIQQDTYIQRARMFGSRGKYKDFFELSIPKSLFEDWHRCFIFHDLSLKSLKSNDEGAAPVWISSQRVKPASSSSIDKKNILTDKNEMYFPMFDYASIFSDIISKKGISNIQKLKEVNRLYGGSVVPLFLINFIVYSGMTADKDIAFHPIRMVSKTDDLEYKDFLYRSRGVFGGTEMVAFPNAKHHIMLIRNEAGKCRFVYYFKDSLKKANYRLR
ncbi:MAG: Z1 domain-containing protein [bacterium]